MGSAASSPGYEPTGAMFSSKATPSVQSPGSSGRQKDDDSLKDLETSGASEVKNGETKKKSQMALANSKNQMPYEEKKHETGASDSSVSGTTLSKEIKIKAVQKQNKTELEKTLKSLSLSAHDMQSALKLLKEHPELFQHFKTATDSILHMHDAEVRTGLNSLENLNFQFFDIEYKDRAFLADFLVHVQFCKESFIKYKTILKSVGLDNFNDLLLTEMKKIPDDETQVIFMIRSHWWNFSDSSTMFGNQLASEGVLQALVQDVVSLIGTEGRKLKLSFTFESAVGTLHNCAKIPNLRQTFRELNFVDTLGNFLNYEEQPKVTMLVLMTLALIIDENQTHLLTSHDSVFDLMLLIINRAWKMSDHRYDGFSVEELLQALCGLSKNDAVKKVLVQKGVLVLVLKIFQDGEEKEIESATKLLWELSFDPDNKTKIQENAELMKAVKDLSSSSNRKVARAAQGVLWVIGMDTEGLKKPAKKKKEGGKREEEQAPTGHVMISYNWADQKKLIEIRDVLRSQGYKIWMDIDNISGSTLQAMAEAVEQASVVLVCMSEKYKESPNCRSEAEYAFSLKKPIIPLLMQFGYKPDGWLGILLGAKLFFDFSGKYPFEMKKLELVKEIGDRGKMKQDRIDGVIVQTAAAEVGKSPQALHTSQLNVLDWISENKLAKYSCLRSLSTEHLQFLKKLSSRAPEFYYSFMLDLLSGKVTADSLTGLMMVTSAVEKIPR